jgi:HNH endonuclease/NUMOD3 motif
VKKMCIQCNLELDISCFEKNRNKCKECRKQSKKKVQKQCEVCGKYFKVERRFSGTRYCSHKCHGKTRVKRITVTCAYCGAEKQVVPSLYQRLESFYCNQNCRTEHLKIIMKGENNPNYISIERECDGCKEKIKVKPYQLKQKYVFCSYECYKQNIGQYFKGENNWNYNPNLSPEERERIRATSEYWEWRKAVYERDNYTCQCCGDNRGGNLVAHHLYSYSDYPTLRTDLENGVTLCKDCHISFHKQYGFGKNTKEQFIEFLKTHGNQQPSLGITV